jgi:hypothetical protein
VRFSLQVASLLPSIDSLPRKREYESPLKCHEKILRTPDCHGLDADLISIVLGGTAALHTVGVGGGNFFNHEIGCARLAISQPTEWQRIRNQTHAAFVFARADFVNVD